MGLPGPMNEVHQCSEDAHIIYYDFQAHNNIIVDYIWKKKKKTHVHNMWNAQNWLTIDIFVNCKLGIVRQALASGTTIF